MQEWIYLYVQMAKDQLAKLWQWLSSKSLVLQAAISFKRSPFTTMVEYCSGDGVSMQIDWWMGIITLLHIYVDTCYYDWTMQKLCYKNAELNY